MKNDEYFVMSHRAARHCAYQELTKVDREYPCLMEISGAGLIGKRVKAPLSKYDQVFVLPMTSISMDKGTGIVTSVPSDSPDDYAMLKDL
jgi:leucyl-tRNA synthetase